MITIPDNSLLQPRINSGVYTFPSDSTPIVKLDLLFEAGSAYQPQPLCATAANRLCTVATTEMDAEKLAEFMDYRGIIIEPDTQVWQSGLSFYFLRCYAEEVLPVIGSMLRSPAFSEADFAVWCGEKREQMSAHEMESTHVARRLFYHTLYGECHPLGRYAVPADVDRLDINIISRYHQEHYSLGADAVVLAGNVDDELVALVAEQLLRKEKGKRPKETKLHTLAPTLTPLPSVQTTLRIGRLLPLQWDDPDYARLMLLTTMLGGYFGSRLMSNLREDKGYTYGIYARTQLYRDSIVFYITADVAGGSANDAQGEIFRELEGLANISDVELQHVKQVMVGDFLRSVDGIFERSERFCNMLSAGITERLTDNLRQAVATATTSELQELALRLLQPADMTVCRAGTE